MGYAGGQIVAFICWDCFGKDMVSRIERRSSSAIVAGAPARPPGELAPWAEIKRAEDAKIRLLIALHFNSIMLLVPSHKHPRWMKHHVQHQ